MCCPRILFPFITVTDSKCQCIRPPRISTPPFAATLPTQLVPPLFSGSLPDSRLMGRVTKASSLNPGEQIQFIRVFPPSRTARSRYFRMMRCSEPALVSGTVMYERRINILKPDMPVAVFYVVAHSGRIIQQGTPKVA